MLNFRIACSENRRSRSTRHPSPIPPPPHPTPPLSRSTQSRAPPHPNPNPPWLGTGWAGDGVGCGGVGVGRGWSGMCSDCFDFRSRRLQPCKKIGSPAPKFAAVGIGTPDPNWIPSHSVRMTRINIQIIANLMHALSFRRIRSQRSESSCETPTARGDLTQV